MSITLKQLKALSEEFKFDYLDARVFLGHGEQKKRGRPTKKSDDSDSGSNCSGGKCSPKAKATDKATDKAVKRGPTGYQVFMVNVSTKVSADLKKAAGDKKLEPGAVFKEVGKRWGDLSDRQKETWNKKASST